MTAASPVTSSTYIRQASKEYAIYVCDTRGIPLVSDGLKSGQRMALWLLRNRAEKIKTYALSGLLGYERLYVHGEASANGAIGLLAAPYKNNVCLIEGLGQFGNRVAPDKDGIGAPRYTEVRRAKAAEAILYVDLDLVPLCDNYDGSNKQPVTFLPLIPTVLLNGVTGVAVGWSTDILPRSLDSLIDATIKALNGEEIETIPPQFRRYDVSVAPTGRPNQWEFSGRAKILDSSTIQIDELPPGLSLEAFRRTLIEMEDSKKIVNFIDWCTDSILIRVQMPRGSLDGWTEDMALDFLKLREKRTERIVVVDWDGDGIRTYDTAEALVRDFATWRLGWYTKRFEKRLADDMAELAYWRALISLFDNDFTKKLGSFKSKADMKAAATALIAKQKLDATDEQIERLIAMPTYRWTVEFATEVREKITTLLASIREHEAVLASPALLKDAYVQELNALSRARVG